MNSRNSKRGAALVPRVGRLEGDVLSQLTGGEILWALLLSGRSTSHFYKKAYRMAQAKQAYGRAIVRLERRGYIRKNGEHVDLTDEGKQLLELLEMSKRFKNEKYDERSWSGHFWVCTYDIPVSSSSYRFALRSLLIKAGFRQLQQSVWIHSFETPNVHAFLKVHKKIAKYVVYFETLPFLNMMSFKDWQKLPTALR